LARDRTRSGPAEEERRNVSEGDIGLSIPVASVPRKKITRGILATGETGGNGRSYYVKRN